MIASFIIVACIIGLIVYALMHKASLVQAPVEESVVQDTTEPTTTVPVEKESTPIKKSMDTTKRTLENFTPVAKVDTLKKVDLVVGSGAEVKVGATVSVHYTGAIASTGAVFQSSKDFGTTPITFPLSGVIKGWTDGIPGMKVGGTRRLLIPAAQAYGATPPPGSGIPANADLVFDVELIAVQ